MIYIIISNVGFAIMTLVVYFRYSHFRISSSIKIRDLKKQIDEMTVEAEQMIEQARKETKVENTQVKKLLHDLENFRKEKEEEMRLRLEAEKQIEIAMQKIHEVEKRIADWREIQKAALQDSKHAIFKIGTDIYDRLVEAQKHESKESRNVIDSTMKNFYQQLESLSKNVEEFKNKATVVGEKTSKAASSATTTISKASPIQLDDFTKKKLSDVASLIKDSGFIANKDYVLTESLANDETKLRMMLCDLIFLRDKTVYFVDFKAIRYFKEYEKMKQSNKDSASEALGHKLDKYILFISNPKYLAALQKLMAEMKIKYSKTKLIFAVSSRDDMLVLKEIKYLQKVQEANIELMDVDAVSDLAL